MAPEPDPDGMASLPVTMADIFLALVGVVVIMLLSLAPAIRTPGALAPRTPFEVWRAQIAIDGRAPLVLLAEEAGLRLAGPDRAGRAVPLAAVLDDAALAQVLGEAREGVLLVIRPEGQEAAFLFTALAGRLGLGEVHHLRLDGDCAYVVDAVLARLCRGEPAREPGP